MQIICGHVEQNTQGSTSDEMKEPKDKFGSTSDDKLGPNVGERVRSQQCFQETRRTNTNPLIVLGGCYVVIIVMIFSVVYFQRNNVKRNTSM